MSAGREMRVVHATECAASGTLSVLISLAHELAAAGARQIIVYSPRAETPADVEKMFPANVEFERVPAARGLHLAFAAKFHAALARAMRALQPEVLHLHSSKAGFLGRGAQTLHRWPCRTLYSPHGLSFLDPQRPARNALFRSLEWLAARGGAIPVGCGRGEADLLTRLSGREALLLENPVDHFFFDVMRAPAAAPTVVTLGRLSRQKAPENFAAVARVVRQRAPQTRFIWIGDGDAAYRDVLQVAGCEVTGWCNRAEVALHLASAHVYLQSSRWEGLPISVIQALASGVPCVVNDCIGNRDAVTHEVTGFVAASTAALAGAVAGLLEDEGLRAALGAAARVEALRRFGRPAFRAQVRRLYGIAERVPSRASMEAHVISA
jgi:glycosyltransferase involved in cell wall biosynthesis